MRSDDKRARHVWECSGWKIWAYFKRIVGATSLSEKYFVTTKSKVDMCLEE